MCHGDAHRWWRRSKLEWLARQRRFTRANIRGIFFWKNDVLGMHIGWQHDQSAAGWRGAAARDGGWAGQPQRPQNGLWTRTDPRQTGFWCRPRCERMPLSAQRRHVPLDFSPRYDGAGTKASISSISPSPSPSPSPSTPLSSLFPSQSLLDRARRLFHFSLSLRLSLSLSPGLSSAPRAPSRRRGRPSRTCRISPSPHHTPATVCSRPRAFFLYTHRLARSLSLSLVCCRQFNRMELACTRFASTRA